MLSWRRTMWAEPIRELSCIWRKGATRIIISTRSNGEGKIMARRGYSSLHSKFQVRRRTAERKDASDRVMGAPKRHIPSVTCANVVRLLTPCPRQHLQVPLLIFS